MDASGDKAQAVALLLRWYAAMGVEDAVAAESINWLARGDAAPGSGETRFGVAPGAGERPKSGAGQASGVAGGPAQSAVLRNPDVAVMAARELAEGAGNLDALKSLLERFDGCGLKTTAKNLCFYRGSSAADLMVIGEAPGRDEDLAGLPFVGRAGQLLDKMLAAIEVDTDKVHITNIVYWRPPGNRTPSPQEAQACRPFLERQVALVRPRLVVLLGAAAAKAVLDSSEGIMKLRGKWRELSFGGHHVRAMATLHPAFLLRQPIYKQLAWRDLLAVRAAMSEQR